MSFFIIFTNLYVKVYILGEAIILEASKTKEDKVIKDGENSHGIKENILIFCFLFSCLALIFFFSK